MGSLFLAQFAWFILSPNNSKRAQRKKKKVTSPMNSKMVTQMASSFKPKRNLPESLFWEMKFDINLVKIIKNT